ncbi:MAG: V-type ATP synthase subunit F [Syntrophales bacterium]|nr:V-type ATP synthase subunit F [Syntrophales bacterium]
MKFFCIGDEDTVRGFRLAGVAGEAVTTAGRTFEALERVLKQPDCAIVILTTAVADLVRERVEDIRLERDCPLIVEIPGPGGPAAGSRSLRKFVQEAVGIRLGKSEGP